MITEETLNRLAEEADKRFDKLPPPKTGIEVGMRLQDREATRRLYELAKLGLRAEKRLRAEKLRDFLSELLRK